MKNELINNSQLSNGDGTFLGESTFDNCNYPSRMPPVLNLGGGSSVSGGGGGKEGKKGAENKSLAKVGEGGKQGFLPYSKALWQKDWKDGTSIKLGYTDFDFGSLNGGKDGHGVKFSNGLLSANTPTNLPFGLNMDVAKSELNISHSENQGTAAYAGADLLSIGLRTGMHDKNSMADEVRNISVGPGVSGGVEAGVRDLDGDGTPDYFADFKSPKVSFSFSTEDPLRSYVANFLCPAYGIARLFLKDGETNWTQETGDFLEETFGIPENPNYDPTEGLPGDDLGLSPIFPISQDKTTNVLPLPELKDAKSSGSSANDNHIPLSELENFMQQIEIEEPASTSVAEKPIPRRTIFDPEPIIPESLRFNEAPANIQYDDTEVQSPWSDQDLLPEIHYIEPATTRTYLTPY